MNENIMKAKKKTFPKQKVVGEGGWMIRNCWKGRGNEGGWMDEVDHTMETSTEHVTLGRKGEGEWREEGREMVDELVVGGWKVEEGGCMVEEGWWWWMMVGSLKAWI